MCPASMPDVPLRTARNREAEATRARSVATKAKVLALKNREKQTCAFVVERYLVEMVGVNRKTKGADEARRMLERAIVPIARIPARELTRAQARAVIVGVVATARRVAAMTRQELRACWCHASDQGWVEDGTNPFWRQGSRWSVQGQRAHASADERRGGRTSALDARTGVLTAAPWQTRSSSFCGLAFGLARFVVFK